MKHGFFTTLQSPIDSQPSGLNAMYRIQSVERRNGQLARYSGMCVVLYSSITYKRARTSTASIALLERLNDEIEKKRPHLKKKKVLFHQDNAPCNKSIKITAKLHELGYELLPHPPCILQIWPPVIFFCVCRPQKNACWKEI
jgi:hypothetical protein